MRVRVGQHAVRVRARARGAGLRGGVRAAAVRRARRLPARRLAQGLQLQVRTGVHYDRLVPRNMRFSFFLAFKYSYLLF